jgi:hypothetical protein
MTVRVKVVGAGEIAAKLHAYAELLPNVTMDALAREGEFLLAESKKECPHDTGALRNSGYADRQGWSIEVGYSQAYALRQHEEMSYRHKPPTKAKYLEDPFDRNAPFIHMRVAQSVRRAL